MTQEAFCQSFHTWANHFNQCRDSMFTYSRRYISTKIDICGLGRREAIGRLSSIRNKYVGAKRSIPSVSIQGGSPNKESFHLCPRLWLMPKCNRLFICERAWVCVSVGLCICKCARTSAGAHDCVVSVWPAGVKLGASNAHIWSPRTDVRRREYKARKYMRE